MFKNNTDVPDISKKKGSFKVILYAYMASN